LPFSETCASASICVEVCVLVMISSFEEEIAAAAVEVAVTIVQRDMERAGASDRSACLFASG
jgi:hypothetical protein